MHNKRYDNDALKQATLRYDIVAFSEKYLTIVRDGAKEVVAECPYCMKNKLSINKEKRLVKCWYCVAEGSSEWKGTANLVTWISLLRKCSAAEAVAEIFKNAGMHSSRSQTAEEYKDYRIPREAMPILAGCNEDHPCRLFLKKRGLSHKAGDWQMCVTGRYKGRIIIPIVLFGKAVGFDAKSYCGQELKSLSNFEPNSIYMTGLFDYGRKYAVITESVFDAETVGVNGVGLMGSLLSEQKMNHLMRLKSFGLTDLYWMLDADALSKQKRIITQWASGMFVNKIVTLPDGEDPNSLGTELCWNYINKAKEVGSCYDLIGIQ